MRHPPSRSTSPQRVSVFYTYIAQQSSVVQLAEADSLLCTGIRWQFECICSRRRRSHTLRMNVRSWSSSFRRRPSPSLIFIVHWLDQLRCSSRNSPTSSRRSSPIPMTNCYCAAISTARGRTTHTSMMICNRSWSRLDWIYSSMSWREAEVFFMSLLQMIAICFLTSAPPMPASS